MTNHSSLLRAPIELLIVCSLLPISDVMAAPISWVTVVNSNDIAPISTGQNQDKDAYFFSENQPSVNDQGLVVFRARAKPQAGESNGGAGGGPTHGIYTRDMSTGNSPISVIADNKNSTVPDPNNTDATFNEFPSFPRSDSESDMVAFRGQSQPVWQVTSESGETITKVGTSGVYTNPTGVLVTGASQLGAVPGFEYFAIPGSTLKIDQFPGAPSPTGGDTVVFKGNYTDTAGDRQTGIFYRNVLDESGQSPVQVIATSGMNIPNETGKVFGSTAPPSAAGGMAVFTGLDNEESPTAGGIYLAPLLPNPTLTPLVDFNTVVPGLEEEMLFNRFGEGLSFDGHYVGFWGAWGDQTKEVRLTCRSDGNAAVIDFCNDNLPDVGYYSFDVPFHQGIFLADITRPDNNLFMLAQTGNESGIDDFLYWNFSGRPPGVGEDGDEGEDFEEPRWRSSAFVAVDGTNAVFKAQLQNGVDALIGSLGLGNPLTTLLDTTMDGGRLDAAAAGLKIATIGVERDGFRNGWLAINASMSDTDGETKWAGVYVARVPEPGTLALIGIGVFLLIPSVHRRWVRN